MTPNLTTHPTPNPDAFLPGAGVLRSIHTILRVLSTCNISSISDIAANSTGQDFSVVLNGLIRVSCEEFSRHAALEHSKGKTHVVNIFLQDAAFQSHIFNIR